MQEATFLILTALADGERHNDTYPPRGCLRQGDDHLRDRNTSGRWGGERWTVTSGTKTYAKLHGRGYEIVDDWADSPATFVLKGIVSSF